MKHLKYFETEAAYNAYLQSEDFILPNVSYALDTDKVFYHIVKTETGDYKVILVSKKNISGLTYNMVDLGLPSGLLWADRNVGASNTEDYGTYFAWGETNGFTYEGVKNVTAAQLCPMLQPIIGAEMELTPDNIDAILLEMGVSDKDLTFAGNGFTSEKAFSGDWSDYFDTTDGGNTFNKYATDKLTVLEVTDDAATVNMGSDWRMPIESEFQELIDNTTITFIDIDGNEVASTSEGNLKGVRFTGSNGNSIFIPASGYCYISSLMVTNTYGVLMSSYLDFSNNTGAKSLFFCSDGDLTINSYPRFFGQAIRGVKSK